MSNAMPKATAVPPTVPELTVLSPIVLPMTLPTMFEEVVLVVPEMCSIAFESERRILLVLTLKFRSADSLDCIVTA
jgi:hypothetical protein